MPAEYKKLYRSQDNRIIGGVCGGLGEYLGVDPTVIRLIYIILALWFGSGILAYIIFLILVPEEPVDPIKTPQQTNNKEPALDA